MSVDPYQEKVARQRYEDYSNRIGALQSANQDIATKRQLLKTALDRVDGVFQRSKTLERSIGNYDLGPQWHGDRRETFEHRKSDAYSAAGGFRACVDYVYYQLLDKIRDLDNQMNNNNGIIGDFQDILNDISTDLQKMMHQ
ncbi:hypothetical protein OZX73_02480 [Bifidobacterium sp. ESL0775]|uniref:hypothetical protein n=1 Tax=Bifidobacterium sp. ESL0775 TaxID=2983230 RepID=UPI0023F9A519|nr:hypothetical protein [Bifidobacterium sp. ESL0775]WEV69761.1 hypothetical protein OZX73_02480 [Bifidobacterium sp. ESL0775]